MKTKRGKKYTEYKKLTLNKQLSVNDAIELVKKTNIAKFGGSVELKVVLNTNPKDSEQNIRFMCQVPNSTSRTKKVLAFGDFKNQKFSTLQVTKGSEAEVKKIIDGKLTPKKDFDIVVCQPDFMAKMAQAAKVLGPKGLMPNPKTGTVGELDKVLADLDKGQIEIRTQVDNKVIHLILGKVSDDNKKLVENFEKIVTEINAHKPPKVKKDLISVIYIKATMSPSVKVLV